MSRLLSSSSVSAKILKAMSIFSGVQVLSILCSIIRSKFIAIWLGEAGIGLFAIYNSVLEMVSSATQLNMRQSAVRDISASPASALPRIAGVVRWWGKRLGIFGAIVMVFLAPAFSMASFGSCDNTWWLALLAVAVLALAYTNSEQALMQGAGKLSRLAQSSVTGALIGTLLSLPLYYWLRLDSIVPAIILSALIGATATTIYKDTPSSKNTPAYNKAEGWSFIRLGLYLTISSVVTTGASYAFISYLNITASDAEVGLYQAGYTLVIRYTGIIFTALSMEYFPRLTKVSSRPWMASKVVSHELTLMLSVMTPLLVLFVFIDQWLVRLLYTESFEAMLPFVTIGIVGMIFRATSYCMSYVILSRGDGRTFVVTEVLSSLIGLALNIFGYRYGGFAGLGLSYVLWYLIYTLIIGIVYRRYRMHLTWRAILLTILSLVIVTASVLLKSQLGTGIR